MGAVIRYVLGAVIGVGLWAAFGPQGSVISYPEVIVPAPRIIEREVPGPERIEWRDRIVYRYVQPDVRAVAPEGAKLELSLFCTVPEPGHPARELIRSVQHSQSIFPLRKDRLAVTSMTNTGDLVARDYRVRPGFGIGSGEGVAVRYSRLSIFRDMGHGLAWYGLLRAVEAVVR